MDIQTRTHAATIAKTAEVLDVDLPADYLDELDRAAALEAAASAIALSASPSTLNSAVLDAIENGADYATDKTVQRLLLDRQLAAQNIGQASRDRGNQIIADAIAAHSDSILFDMSDALERHSAGLVAAAKAIPNVKSLRDVAAAGVGNAFETWAKARTAEDAWKAGFAAFGAIADVCRITYTAHTMPLIYTPADATDIAAARELATAERSRDLGVWIMARAGVPLSLPSGLGEFMQRVAHFEQQGADFQREREHARNEAGFDGIIGR